MDFKDINEMLALGNKMGIYKDRNVLEDIDTIKRGELEYKQNLQNQQRGEIQNQELVKNQKKQEELDLALESIDPTGMSDSQYQEEVLRRVLKQNPIKAVEIMGAREAKEAAREDRKLEKERLQQNFRESQARLRADADARRAAQTEPTEYFYNPNNPQDFEVVRRGDIAAINALKAQGYVPQGAMPKEKKESLIDLVREMNAEQAGKIKKPVQQQPQQKKPIVVRRRE